MKRFVHGILLIAVLGIGIYLVWQWLHLLLAKPVPAIGLALAIALSIAVSVLFDRHQETHALRHMQDRPKLNSAEFGRRYFSPPQAEIAAGVREIFAKHICVDISQVLPEDRLVEDLRMDALDSMSTVEFVIDLEKHFQITIPDSAAEKMRTLRDVTDFINRELEGKQRA